MGKVDERRSQRGQHGGDAVRQPRDQRRLHIASQHGEHGQLQESAVDDHDLRLGRDVARESAPALDAKGHVLVPVAIAVVGNIRHERLRDFLFVHPARRAPVM